MTVLNEIQILSQLSKKAICIFKVTLSQIWKFHYAQIHTKEMPWKFRIVKPKNSAVIYL